jgi:hypothetical protein
MSGPIVSRFTAAMGLVAAVLFIGETPLYFLPAYSGSVPTWNVLTRNLIGVIALIFLLLFLAGFRQLVRRASPEDEWVAGLAFSAGLLLTAITMVAKSLESGSSLASTVPIDPTTQGPLAPGEFLLYGGFGRLVTALLLAAAGFALLRTGILPRWTGWTAYVFAVLNLAFVPAMYFGKDAAEFYTAQGWGTTALSASLIAYWVLAVSIVLLKNARRTEYAPGRIGAPAASL